MWWYRIIALCLVLGLPSGCGFHPLYGRQMDGNTVVDLASVKIEPITNRIGQQLRNQLLDVLNPSGEPAHPSYTLSVRVTESISEVAVDDSAFGTRANLQVDATFDLHEAKTRKQLLSSANRVVGSYNILGSDFATMAARKTTVARATLEIANDIRTKLAVFFARKRQLEEKSAP